MNIDQDNIERRLESCLPEAAGRDEICRLIVGLEPHWRRFALEWVSAASQSHAEIALQFARQAGDALNRLGQEGCQRWLQAALDVFDRDGVNAALESLQNLDQYIRDQRKLARGLALAEARGVLEIFLHGLEGRALKLEASNEILTDGEHLFVPERIDDFVDGDRNFDCYRACVVHQWAQCWYGTWRADTIAQIPREEPMARTFHFLETLRLNACLQRDYPGLARRMRSLTPVTSEWHAVAAELEDPASTVLDSIRLSHEHWDKPRPDRFRYQGVLDPDRVQSALEARLERERRRFRILRAQLEQDPDPDSPAARELAALEVSIRQDLGHVPPSYLEPPSEEEIEAAPPAADAGAELDPEVTPGTFVYDEWDYARKSHRKRWCALRERDITPDHDSDFVTATLQKYRGQVKTLRRSFEALRDEYRILKRQPDGENLDIDALVEAIADTRSGMEMTSRIYRKAHRVERDIAVVFMVDMSGSMKDWLNLVQREALILLAEALQTLDDRYAIYGFSSNTRKRCELYRIKAFDEAYDLDVRARIAAIEPQHFTRMGVTIRHLSRMLEQVSARSKLLITLSDGRPYDYDNYSDEYAIEDTRMALYEARQLGIHPFCITIDEEARDYLPHMYGDTSYILINDAAKLPCRISEIYRSLTS